MDREIFQKKQLLAVARAGKGLVHRTREYRVLFNAQTTMLKHQFTLLAGQ